MADEIVAVYRAEVEQYKKAVDELVGKVDKLDNEQRKASESAKGMGVQMRGLGKEIVSAFGITAGIAGFVTLMRGAFNAAKDFEAQMSKVRAVSGATNEEMKKLDASAKALGASTMFTATQVGQLQEEYARLGFTTKEILAATEATLNLAAATGETLAASAQVAGSTVRGFGLDASETARVADVMALSFSKSALNLSDFAEGMKLVAPIARAANIPLETATALLGKLADSGLRGSIAGTALKNLLSKLADGNSDLSKELGFSVKNTEDLYRAFQILAKGHIDLTKATELTDERSKAAFITLLNGIDSVETLKTALDGAAGSAKTMADIMQDNLQGSITRLSSAWEGLTNKILGSQGGIKLVVDLLTESVTGWTIIMERLGGITAEQVDLIKRGMEIVKLSTSQATIEIEKIVKPLEEAGDKAAANAKATELAAAASAKLVAKQKLQAQATEDLNKKEAEHQALFKSLNPLNNIKAIALEEELEQLKLRKIAADTEVSSLEAVISVYERYVEQLKAAGGEGGAIESNVRSIELLSGQLKTLKDSLHKAEIGSDGFWNVLFKIEKKLKELRDAEAMTKLIEDLTPDADDTSEQDAKIYSEVQAEIDKYNRLKKEREDFNAYLSKKNKEEIRDELDKINEIEEANKDAQEEKEKQKQKEREAFVEFGEMAISLINGIAQAQAAASQYELQVLDEQLEQGQISREQYDEERRRIMRKQATDAKALGILEAVIATAVAVTKAYPNIPLAIIAGVLGAIQIGVIAAQPIPQFATGVIGLQGAGTETSDSIPAMLSRGESVMTAAETRKYRPILEGIRRGTLDEIIRENYVRPAIDAALLNGFADMGNSAALQDRFNDMNLLRAIDRHRESEVGELRQMNVLLGHLVRKPKRGYA